MQKFSSVGVFDVRLVNVSEAPPWVDYSEVIKPVRIYKVRQEMAAKNENLTIFRPCRSPQVYFSCKYLL